MPHHWDLGITLHLIKMLHPRDRRWQAEDTALTAEELGVVVNSVESAMGFAVVLAELSLGLELPTTAAITSCSFFSGD